MCQGFRVHYRNERTLYVIPKLEVLTNDRALPLSELLREGRKAPGATARPGCTRREEVGAPGSCEPRVPPWAAFIRPRCAHAGRRRSAVRGAASRGQRRPGRTALGAAGPGPKWRREDLQKVWKDHCDHPVQPPTHHRHAH